MKKNVLISITSKEKLEQLLDKKTHDSCFFYI